MRRHGELEQSIALDAAKRDIASRIRCVCEHLSEEEFTQLVARMAMIDVKYRLRDDWLLALAPEYSEHTSAMR